MTLQRNSDWHRPRPFKDAPQRLHTYGPVQSQDEPPGWFARMIGKWL